MKTPNKQPEPTERDSHGNVVHVYDDIVEHDNHLPRWWLYTLFGTIVFAAGYWVYYHNFQKGQLPAAEYNEARSRKLAAEAAEMRELGEATPELFATLAKDPTTVELGKATFAETCATCHAAGGKGFVGPNLTDDYWLHGGDSMSIYKTIRDGVPGKAMAPWGKPLGEGRTRAVSAYVLTLKGTNVDGGKAPEGEQVVSR